MKCSDSKRHVLLLLMVIVPLFIGFISHTVAQEDTGTVTGRVVDLDGNPVVELPIFIAPLDVGGDGDMWTVFLPNEYAQLRRAHTDLEGRFSVTDVPSGPVYIGALPDDIDERLPKDFEKLVDEFISIDWTETTQNDIEAFVSSNFGMDQADFEPDVEILFIRVQGLTLYPRTDSAEIAFGLKSGAHLKDVEVTVQPRMRVRGCVLFKDGTPLANTRVGLYARSRTVDGYGSSGSGGDLWTDTEGYFVLYIDEKDDAAFYTFSVEYQDLTVEAEPIRLDPGDRFDGLTLTFDSEPIPPKQPPQKIETDELEPLSPAWEVPSVPTVSHDVWVVNPENGHAYKRIHCETRDDAIVQATEEKAHLVAINDAAEQAWLEAVFGRKFYWIGLSRVPTTGALSKRTKKWWQWDNGDPITYANWLPNEFFSEVLDASERDYAVMTLSDGKWYAVSPDSVIWDMTEMAILEKADVLDNPSAAERQ
ncbi:MAG: lectin-like protein [Candidatus Poribacteria bacterium]|nr:lectin-like protein [Candidatus Poribacteria bacterium]